MLTVSIEGVFSPWTSHADNNIPMIVGHVSGCEVYTHMHACDIILYTIELMAWPGVVHSTCTIGQIMTPIIIKITNNTRRIIILLLGRTCSMVQR